MSEREFSELLDSIENDIVPLYDLFQIAYSEINDDFDKLNSMYKIFSDDNECSVTVLNKEDDVGYTLTVYRDWKITFYYDNILLEINHFLLYKRLIELGFIRFELK